MKQTIIIACLALIYAASVFGAADQGYEVTINEKTDMFLNNKKVTTIPEMALFRAIKLREDWVFGTYKDVDTDEVQQGWIKMEGIADLDKMLTDLKAESENYLLDGERMFEENKYGQAVKLLTASIDRHPEQPHALHLRAQSYLFLGRKNEAGVDYSMIIKLDPDSEQGIDALLSRANLYIEKKDYKRAVADLKQVVETQPNNAEAYLHMGIIQALVGRQREAVAMYDKGIANGPEMSALFYRRGLAHFYLNLFDESREDLTKSIELTQDKNKAMVYQRALASVNQKVQTLLNVAPEEVQKALDVRLAEKESALIFTITNHSQRPFLNIEIAAIPYLEDTFEKEKDERSNDESRSFSRGESTEKKRVSSLDIQTFEIKYLPKSNSRINKSVIVLTGESFKEDITGQGKQYFGCLFIVFMNKQEVLMKATPNSLKKDFEDDIMDLKIEIQAEDAR